MSVPTEVLLDLSSAHQVVAVLTRDSSVRAWCIRMNSRAQIYSMANIAADVVQEDDSNLIC